MRQTTAPTVMAAEQDALNLFPSERDHPAGVGRSAGVSGVRPASSTGQPSSRPRRRSGVTISVARVSWGVRLGLVGVLLAGALGALIISRVAGDTSGPSLAPLLLSRH